METPTPEQIKKHISAASDSVNLINATVLLESTEKRQQTVERNYKHLEIMMNKSWFAEALTEEQEEAINDSIDAGKEYAA